ncbi:MAG TPA: metal-dependent hydrolase [Anaerolineae bacterium]|jgi:L-ascorbate metabolism protein UlaG (beta-lactamase superfamily)
MAIKYTFVGHATHIFEIGGKRIVVDPFFTSNPFAEASADSVEADYLLVSHGHFDHIEDAVAIAKNTGATVIANFEIISWFQGQGVAGENCHPQHLGGGFNYDFGRVKFTVAHHGSGLPDGSYGGNPAGFLISAEGKNIYLACDTALFSDMALYGENGVDLYVPPIGDNFTMGPDDALRSVQLVKPKVAVPCHYNTWPYIEQDGQTWAKRVEDNTSTKVQVLGPGDSLDV